jgi:general secretion pathway protein D
MRFKKILIGFGCAILASAALSQSSGARITPNFRDADIIEVAKAVQEATGKSFQIDPRVRAQINWLSTTPLTTEQFYQGFLSALAIHNFVAIPSGNIVKILPADNMRQLPANDLPGRVSTTSDEVVTQIVAVKSVSAAQLVPTLRVLMPQNANIGVVTGSNMLIITDRANNVSRIMRIIERIDREGSADVSVIPLENASAADTVKSLTTLIGTTGAEAGGNMKIVADERSNSVLVSGDSASRARIKALVAQLDSPTDAGSETKVRALQYADAENLATKLKEQMSSTNSANAARGGAGAQVAAGPASLSLAGGTATIWADKDTNSLVMTAPPRTMRALESVINSLDIRRAQVLVEAIIVEVSATGSADLGVNWLVDGSGRNIGAGGFVTPVGSSAPILDLVGVSQGTGTLPADTGAIFGVGRLAATGTNFAAVLKALQTDARNNIIATPQVTTQDNQEAKLSASREVPFVTGQYTGTTGTTSAFQTIQRQQVGTILTVTPKISNGDSVLLKIDAESSELESARTSGAADLVTKKRTIATTVRVKDDETLVLGGLISEESNASEARVPYLGRIPLLGELFRSRHKAKDKRNLLIFIHPKIIRDDEQAAEATNAKYDFLREQQQKLNKETTLLPLISKKGARVLPARTPPAKSSDALPVPAPTPATEPAEPPATAPATGTTTP